MSIVSEDIGMVEYLQMIQNTISRMSTASALFKGFTATIVAGVFVITFNKTDALELFTPLVCVAGFIYMDVYYLQLERRFRFMYDEVRCGEHPIDYSMKPPEIKTIKSKDPENKSKTKLLSCVFSRSILLFYIPVIVSYAVLIIYKLCVKG